MSRSKPACVASRAACRASSNSGRVAGRRSWPRTRIPVFRIEGERPALFGGQRLAVRRGQRLGKQAEAAGTAILQPQRGRLVEEGTQGLRQDQAVSANVGGDGKRASLFVFENVNGGAESKEGFWDDELTGVGDGLETISRLRVAFGR